MQSARRIGVLAVAVLAMALALAACDRAQSGTPVANQYTRTTSPTTTDPSGPVGQPVAGLYNLRGNGAAETGYTTFLTIAPQDVVGSHFLAVDVIASAVDGSETQVETFDGTATAGQLPLHSYTFFPATNSYGGDIIATYTTGQPPSITFPSDRCGTLWASYTGGGTNCTFVFSHS